MLCFFAFCTTTVAAQQRIRSLQDIPYTNKQQALEYGKMLVKQLQRPPDTINNEWERYLVRYVNTCEFPFYGELHYRELCYTPVEKPFTLSWDTVTLRAKHRLSESLFDAFVRDSVDFVCWSHNLGALYTRDEAMNILKTERDELLPDIQIWTDSGYQKYAVPLNYSVVHEIAKFIVIEKTTRTKQRAIRHELLAIAPILTVYEDEWRNSISHKLLCWFVLK